MVLIKIKRFIKVPEKMALLSLSILLFRNMIFFFLNTTITEGHLRVIIILYLNLPQIMSDKICIRLFREGYLQYRYADLILFQLLVLLSIASFIETFQNKVFTEKHLFWVPLSLRKKRSIWSFPRRYKWSAPGILYLIS